MRPSRISASSSTTSTLPRLLGDAAIRGDVISCCIYRLPRGAGSGEREFQMEGGAAAAPVGHFDRATMLLNDTVGHRKPEPCPLAGGLRREERIVDAVDVLRGNAVARIRHFHTHAGA